MLPKRTAPVPEVRQTDNSPDEGEAPPFVIVEVDAPTQTERLGLYAIYREMGGEPYEPEESQLAEAS